MDISNTFKTEVFRPIVTTLIPGGFALMPFALTCYFSHEMLRIYFESHQLGVMVVYAFISIAAGLVIEDIGSRVETVFDWLADKKTGTHHTDWHLYLRTHFEHEPVGVGYIDGLVLRLKFELSFSISIILFLIGFVILNNNHELISGSAFFGIFLTLSALSAFLLYESFAGVKLLGKVRNELLSGVKCM